MSWQRILESARKNGFPIIVTDIAGREPMVVMPFDAFEEMNEAYHSTLDRWEDGLDEMEYAEVREDEGRDESTVEPPAERGASAISDEFSAEEDNKTVADHWPEFGPEEDVSHLSMEDRFYLEPVDEDETP